MSSAKGLDDGLLAVRVGTGRVDVAAAVTTPCARPARCSSATTRGRTARATPRSPTTSPSPTTATDVTLDLTLTRDGRCVHPRRVHGHRAGRRQGDGPGHR